MRLFQKTNEDGSTNPVWQCWFWIPDTNKPGKKRRVKRSTNCTDKQAAKTEAKRIEREAMEVASDPDKAVQLKATLWDAMEAFLKQLTSKTKVGKKSPATLRFYQHKVNSVCKGFGRIVAAKQKREELKESEYLELGKRFMLMQVSYSSVDDYIEQRRLCKVTEGTIFKELVTLRSALVLAYKRGQWAGDTKKVLPVGFSPDYKARSRAPTKDEVDRLVKELGANHGAWISLIVATSARYSEAKSALREDIDLNSGYVHIRGTKTKGSFRVVPVVLEWQRKHLEYALDYADGDGGKLLANWTNSNMVRDLERACVRLGIEKVTPNDMRRACATWLRMDGVPLDLISLVMGHKTTHVTHAATMTQIAYARLTGQQVGERIRAVLPKEIQAHAMPIQAELIEDTPDSHDKTG